MINNIANNPYNTAINSGKYSIMIPIFVVLACFIKNQPNKVIIKKTAAMPMYRAATENDSSCPSDLLAK